MTWQTALLGLDVTLVVAWFLALYVLYQSVFGSWGEPNKLGQFSPSDKIVANVFFFAVFDPMIIAILSWVAIAMIDHRWLPVVLLRTTAVLATIISALFLFIWLVFVCWCKEDESVEC